MTLKYKMENQNSILVNSEIDILKQELKQLHIEYMIKNRDHIKNYESKIEKLADLLSKIFDKKKASEELTIFMTSLLNISIN